MEERTARLHLPAPAQPAAPPVPAPPPGRRPAPFRRVLCALDGGRGGSEAFHQALAICDPDTRLRLVAVRSEEGRGFAAAAEMTEMHARHVLETSLTVARSIGVEADVRLLRGGPVSSLLLREAADHDLLVIGAHAGSRLRGVLLGGTATRIVHRSERPVLIARHSGSGNLFPQSVLVASDGSPGSWAAARTATELARARRAELRLVYVPDGMHPEHYREVRRQLSVIAKATGRPAAVVEDPGPAAERIVEAGRAAQAKLIVIGHRGLTGPRALGSVSEGVVFRAQSSVLVVPAIGRR